MSTDGDVKAIMGRPRMSLRDWFAGQALQSAGLFCDDTDKCSPETHAQYAYRQADAMLAERNKR